MRKTYDGNMDNANAIGTEGINYVCDQNYAGSHACTYDEIIKLGDAYTYALHAWIVDGLYVISDGDGSRYTYVTKDGEGAVEDITAIAANCDGWTSATRAISGEHIWSQQMADYK